MAADDRYTPGANPYLDLPDEAFAETDAAVPRRVHAERPAMGDVRDLPPVTPGAAVQDPGATVMAPPPVPTVPPVAPVSPVSPAAQTPGAAQVPAPGAPAAGPVAGATQFIAPAGATQVVPTAGATTVQQAPGATTVQAAPGATVAVPPVGGAAASVGAPLSAADADATVAAPVAVPDRYEAFVRRPDAARARVDAVPTVQDRIAGVGAPDPTKAEMARRMLDANRAVDDEYDAGFGGAARGGVMGERFVRGRWEEKVSKGPLARRRLRFWRWFRAIPIILMLLALAASLLLSALPGASLRHWFYPVSYTDAIEEQAARHGLDPALVAAVIKSESNWVPTAKSGAGAEGLMQVMPSTAAELVRLGYVDGSVYSPDNLSDPETNIAFGTAYLDYLTRTTGSVDEAIAAYNAGPGATQSWREGDQEAAEGDFSSVIQYPETRLYLDKVKDAYQNYQELYPDGLAS